MAVTVASADKYTRYVYNAVRSGNQGHTHAQLLSSFPRGSDSLVVYLISHFMLQVVL